MAVVLAMFKAFVSTAIPEISFATAAVVVVLTAVEATREASRRFGHLLRRVFHDVGGGVWEVWIDPRRTLVVDGPPVGGAAEEPGDIVGLLHDVYGGRGGRAGGMLS